VNNIAIRYEVKFINHYEGFEEPLEIRFSADTFSDVDHIIQALSTHYSGDPYECFVNGDKAVLENDHGLLKGDLK